MIKLLYFSDHIKPIAKKIRFLFIVCARFFIILFRWRKRIKLLQLDYSRKYLFESSYLIIRYRFKNALWYNFKNLNNTTEKQTVIFNLKNIRTDNLTLIVHGFFQKKIYQINSQADNTLEAKSFKTIISGIGREITFASPIKPDRKRTLINLPKINLTTTRVRVDHSPYNQNDFL